MRRPCATIHAMLRTPILFALLLTTPALAAQAPPAIDADQAYAHELPPIRHTFPTQGLTHGDDQMRLTLTISPEGAVTAAEADPKSDDFKFWPQIKDEILRWKFTPFLIDGKPAPASVEEYIDLVPPERFPTTHVQPPALRPTSKVSITLERTMCYGRCPVYSVTLSTVSGITFNGYKVVAAEGKHAAAIDPAAIRTLAARFITADFYSMNHEYRANVTDNPTYTLSITIDSKKKEVSDYEGQSIGMPAVIKDLERSVDDLAQTQQWIKGPASSINQ
jgi:hypothetical protein